MNDYTPKVGDRVRVVIEGQARFISEHPGGGLDLHDEVRNYLGTVVPGSGVTIERLPDPEPEWQPGDVVRDACGSVFTREAYRLPWRLVGAHPAADPWYAHEGPTRPLTPLVRDGKPVQP